MAPGLLAVAHDVDAGLFLAADGEQGGVILGLEQRLAGERPGRPQHVGRSKPRGLGQTAGQGRLEHVSSPSLLVVYFVGLAANSSSARTSGGRTWPKVPGARQCKVPNAPQLSHTERQLS